MRRAVVLLLALALTCAACASEGSGQEPGSQLGVASIATLIGRTPETYRAEADAIERLGATWIRIVLNWNEIEPAPGVFDWSRVDGAVAAARADGLTVLALLSGPAPPWAGAPPFDRASPPRDPASFASFARVAARRYGAHVPAWEVWNEPNLPESWTNPSPAAYARLLRAANSAIKAERSSATVIFGGLSTNPSGLGIEGFVQGVYSAGGGESFDALGLHPYTYPHPLDADPLGRQNVVPALRDVLAARGQPGKQLWITELGQSTGTSSLSVSEQRQSDILIADIRLLRRRTGIGPVFLFTSRDWSRDPGLAELNYGLYRYDYTPKPIVAALRAKAWLQQGR